MTALDSPSLLRRGILAIIVFGCVGLLGELLLLGHYEELNQFPPLVLLVLTLATILWHWIDGGRRSLRVLQVVMLLLIVGGLVGMLLHLGENHEYMRELEPDLVGLDFWIGVVRGDMPTLAPGTLIQFGLLGLLYAYRHPALSSGSNAS